MGENKVEVLLPEVVDPKQFEIEQKQANDLTAGLPAIKAEREPLMAQYLEVIKKDIDDPATAKEARTIRLALVKNRTKGFDDWHKKAKDVFLKGSQFVDAVKRSEVAVNTRAEEVLMQIEKHAEIQEAKRKEELRSKRAEELTLYSEFVPVGLNLGEMDEDQYSKVLKGAQLQYEADLKEKEEARLEQIRLAEVLKLHEQRKELALPYYSFWSDFEKTLNFGEQSEKDFNNFLERVKKEKTTFDKNQEEVEKERNRLAKEKAEAEAKMKAIQDKAEEEARQQRAKQAELEAEIERQRQAQAQAEEKQRLAEQQAREEAEKLAKAPVKQQMTVWVDSFALPTTTAENPTKEDIITKFESFKKWAKNEIEKM